MKPGSTLVLGETDPGARALLHRPRRGGACCGATSTSACATTCSPSAAGSSISTRRCASYADVLRAAARRAPSRQRRDRAHGGRGVPRCAARSREVVAEAFAHGAVTGPARGRAPAAARDPRRRAQRRRRRGAPRPHSPRSSRRGPRTLVVGIMREKDPHEMLTALGIDEVGAARLLPAAERPRARSRASSPTPRIDLGVPGGPDRDRGVGERSGDRWRCCRRPRTARS